MSSSIAVIIPAKDRRHTLSRALDSVFAQTLAPGEVVVVDDGSADGTVAWLTGNYPQVRVIAQSHAGVSAARNRGVSESTSDWIAFLDSDDEWSPNKLERQMEALSARKEYRLCHSDEIWIRNGRRVNPMRKHAKYGGFIFRHCLPLCTISPSSVVIHRTLYDDVGGFDEELPVCEDYDLWLRICREYPVLFIDEPLITKYGGHEDQLSRRYRGMDRYRIAALEKVVGSGALTPDDLTAATAMLLEKIEIYLNGLLKRGRDKEAKLYSEKKIRYQAQPPPEVN